MIIFSRYGTGDAIDSNAGEQRETPRQPRAYESAIGNSGWFPRQ
ncbi:MAG TPA: hypothetical protein P5149_13315 [Candidatus Competibacteraceae bacterium]|nr:hypothetical protein [Candidatus Competibacteraceae bacterium]HRY19369.1 hypothetical protein [Candidatus Competibacteraceae bacterium]